MPVALIAVLHLALFAQPAAVPPKDATQRDFQRLQDDLKNLDELLQGLEPNDPATERFRTRAKALEEDVVYLKVTMRRHQAGGGVGTGVSREDVDRARREAGDLRQDIERAFGGAGRVVLPGGTEFSVRLEQPLSSKTARPEDRFEATVYEPVMAGSTLALAAGTSLRGIVHSVEAAERPSKAGRLDLDFYALYVGDTRFEVRGRVVEVGPHPKTGAGIAKKAGIGSLLGGVLGAMLSGGVGAVIGVVTVGAGAVLGTKGQEVTLPEGTLLTVRLDRPLDLPPPGKP